MKAGQVIVHESIMGTIIDWVTGTAFANATQMGAKYGKLPAQFLRLPSTQELIQAIAEDPEWERENPDAKLREIPLVQMCDNPTFESGKTVNIPGIVYTRRGNNGGTWMHRWLAVEFARWCDPVFGLACNKVVHRLISGESLETAYAQMTRTERKRLLLRLKLSDSEHRIGLDKNRRERDAVRKAVELPGHVALREWLAEQGRALSPGELGSLGYRLAKEARLGRITAGEKTIATNTKARCQRVATYAPEAIAAAHAALFPALLAEG